MGGSTSEIIARIIWIPIGCVMLAIIVRECIKDPSFDNIVTIVFLSMIAVFVAAVYIPWGTKRHKRIGEIEQRAPEKRVSRFNSIDDDVKRLYSSLLADVGSEFRYIDFLAIRPPDTKAIKNTIESNGCNDCDGEAIIFEAFKETIEDFVASYRSHCFTPRIARIRARSRWIRRVWASRDFWSQEEEFRLIAGVSDPPDWSERRRIVVRRDSHKCQRCGRNMKGDPNGHVHHIKARTLESSNHDFDNLILLCKDCHSLMPGHQHMKNLSQDGTWRPYIVEFIEQRLRGKARAYF